MNQLSFTTVAVSGRASIPSDAFKEHFPSEVESLGEQLASQLTAYVEKEKLGYFPALEFARQQECIDDYLLDAYDQVATLALDLARGQILTLLVPIFSNVSIVSLQLVSDTMPTIRLGQANAFKLLAEHLTPKSIMFEINVTLIQKHRPENGLEKAAREMVSRWLSEPFEDLDITSSRTLMPD